MDSEEAKEIGLCNQVFPDSSLDADVEGYCETLLENSWLSLQTYKRLMNETDGLPLDKGLAYEIYHNGGFGPDKDERIGQFLK